MELSGRDKIKWLILSEYDAAYKDYEMIVREFGDIDNAYDFVYDGDDQYDLLDVEGELRKGEIETNIDSPLSRHYENKSVAAQAPDGSWVGWTYWYGGGKHGEPEAIDWMNEAYNLDCVAEEKLVVVRTFTKVEE